MIICDFPGNKLVKLHPFILDTEAPPDSKGEEVILSKHKFNLKRHIPDVMKNALEGNMGDLKSVRARWSL